MTIEELKRQLSAVLNALDTVCISGYQNLCKVQGSMAVLQTIIQGDIISGDESPAE